jgi:hypothetical protein
VADRDPNSYIQSSAAHLAETLASKNSDYAPTGEFSNFERAAEVAGIPTLQVMLAQAAIKMTRIQSLTNPVTGTFENESLRDSFLDLAGYAVIAHAYMEATDVGPRPDIECENSPAGTHRWIKVSGVELCAWCPESRGVTPVNPDDFECSCDDDDQ